MQVNYKAGQSLLVIVLLIAIVFTLIASASYRLTTETQSAKIQEETVRTLAAADSGIEKGLQQMDAMALDDPQTFASLGIGLSGINVTASTVTIETASGQFFISPDVPKDGQYTFYLYDYPNGTTYFNSAFQLSFGPQVTVAAGCGAGRTIPALEVTRIRSDNVVLRDIIEPCTTNPSIQYNAGTNRSFTNTNHNIVANGVTQSYGYRASFTAAEMNNIRLLMVRSLFSNTYLGFSTATGTLSFPIQGRTITSEAVSNTGISKIVTLFRSNPQLPADFFVTTF